MKRPSVVVFVPAHSLSAPALTRLYKIPPLTTSPVSLHWRLGLSTCALGDTFRSYLNYNSSLVLALGLDSENTVFAVSE